MGNVCSVQKLVENANICLCLTAHCVHICPVINISNWIKLMNACGNIFHCLRFPHQFPKKKYGWREREREKRTSNVYIRRVVFSFSIDVVHQLHFGVIGPYIYRSHIVKMDMLNLWNAKSFSFNVRCLSANFLFDSIF